MPEEVENLVKSLYRLGLVQREIARHALAELGSQGFTALAVIRTVGPLRVSEIAERLSIDVSVASRQVNSLISAGYARRDPDEADGRAHRITATESGAKALTESHGRMVAAFSQALDGWSAKELTELAAHLNHLIEDFSKDTRLSEEDPE
ncbi:MAG: MarR family winged helix-turn-helix transcriptional regulator [Solirubrobacterales bacterium]